MKKLTRGFIILISYFIYQILILIPLELLNIDIAKLSLTTKTIYLLGCDFLYIAFLITMFYKDLKKDIKDFKKNYKKYIDTNIICWLIGLALMTTTNLLISLLTPIKMAGNEEAIRDLLTKAPIYMIIGTSIVAPITEELIFRKGLRDLFNNKFIYLLISGFIFGSLHVIYSFTTYYDLLYIIPYGSLGFMFAYLYYKTNNILNPIIMHAIHNTILVLLFLVSK